MATKTFTIPTTTLPVGQSTFGPVNNNAATQAEISIDRTISGGLNSLTGSTVLDLAIQSSPDGVTWNGEAEMTSPGGIIVIKGQTATVSSLTVSPLAPSSQQRVIATVSGPSSVVVAGTITTQ